MCDTIITIPLPHNLEPFTFIFSPQMFIFIYLSHSYIVTELCVGNLQDLVLSNYLEPPMDITPEEILYKIVKGVHRLHLFKIVHGDLKPTNVLDSSVKGDLGPMLKIADFGLRHHTNELGSVEQQFLPACTQGWYCPFNPIDGKGSWLLVLHHLHHLKFSSRAFQIL
jgi:serine/threonine protein kinase